jgi:hypothetical protein
MSINTLSYPYLGLVFRGCERLMLQRSNILNVSRFREITQIDFIVQACFPTE